MYEQSSLQFACLLASIAISPAFTILIVSIAIPVLVVIRIIPAPVRLLHLLQIHPVHVTNVDIHTPRVCPVDAAPANAYAVAPALLATLPVSTVEVND